MLEFNPDDFDDMDGYVSDTDDLESLQVRRSIVINGERVEFNANKVKPAFTAHLKPRPMGRFARKPEPVRKMDRAGYVYVLKSPTGTFKIGRSKDPNDRIKTFNVKLPFEVEFEHLIKTDDMYQLESQLHKRFAAQRVGGEFFSLTQSDIDMIKGEFPHA